VELCPAVLHNSPAEFLEKRKRTGRRVSVPVADRAVSGTDSSQRPEPVFSIAKAGAPIAPRVSMKSALVIALGVVLTIAVTHRRQSPIPQNSDTGALENELSLVQIEKMRVISPDPEAAARLSQREEELKYALLAGSSGENTTRRQSVRRRPVADYPEPVASGPLCPFAVSGKRTPQS